jgi:hypothetical protein
MRKVSSERLTPGMKLARPVCNANGMVLLGENTELTDVLIERVKDMDVGSVYVQGTSQQEVPKDVVLAGLDKRFEGTETEVHMALLRQILREHIEALYE